MRPHRRQPTRLLHPWDPPGKNTGVGCHFLLQCMEVKSESEVAQSCLLQKVLSDAGDTHSAEIPFSLRAKKTNETLVAMIALSEKTVARKPVGRLIHFWNLQRIWVAWAFLISPAYSWIRQANAICLHIRGRIFPCRKGYSCH